MGLIQLGEIKKPNKDVLDFVNFLQTRKRPNQQISDKSQVTTWHSEFKWKRTIIQALNNMTSKDKYKEFAIEIKEVVEEIKIEHFIKAISVLSAMDNQQVIQLNSRSLIRESTIKAQVRLSKNVFVNMDKPFTLKQKFNESIQTETSSSSPQMKAKRKGSLLSDKQLKQKINIIAMIEFNRPYHPFYHIKQAFSAIFHMKYRTKLNSLKLPINDQQKQKIYSEIHKDLDFFCELVSQAACIYKKWILKYTGIAEDKYYMFMKRIVHNSIFYGTHNMHEKICDIIKQLNQPYFEFLNSKIPEAINVKKFFINEELQIEGNYVNSLQLISQIDHINSPRRILDLLECLKNEICNDIDLFHKYFETNQNYTIDGDNLLGILCFLVCRMKPKLTEIFSQLMLLTAVYGDAACISFGASSYMVTALLATYEYIEGKEFEEQSQ